MESNNYPVPPNKYEDEVTLGELIRKFQEYAVELWDNKWIIVLFCIPFFTWQIYKYSMSYTTYPATVTFMIDEGEGGGFSLSGILGPLNGAQSQSNFDQIVALSKSMRIVQEVMLTKALVEDRYDFLGNHLINLEKINEEHWSKNKVKSDLPTLNGFLFTRDSFEKFSRLEYSAMKYLQEVLNGTEKKEGIFSADYDKNSGIMDFKVACRSEELSITLLNTFYQKLSAFYIEKKIEKNIATYSIVKQKADSIRRVLNSLELRQATFDDASHSVLLNVDKVPSQRYSRDRQLLTLMYGESAKNLELADFALKSSTPYIQLIDNAVPPLKKKSPSKINILIFGFIFGLLSGSIYIILRKIFRDSLSNQKKPREA